MPFAEPRWPSKVQSASDCSRPYHRRKPCVADSRATSLGSSTLGCDILAAWELLLDTKGNERPVKAAFNCGLATQLPTQRFTGLSMR